LVQLGIIEVALPADWRLLVELSVDVADTNNYQAIFLEFLHQRQADHTAGRPLTDRDERMETHPLEGDEHGEYTPLEIDLLWIGRHRLRQHLSADGSEQFGTQYTGWLESLDRFRF